MITVHLDDYFSRFTGGETSIPVEGATLAQCLRALLNSYPQLHIALVETNRSLLFTLNDEEILGEEDLGTPIASGELSIILLPDGAEEILDGIEIADMAMKLGASFDTAMKIYYVATALNVLMQLAMLASLVTTVVGAALALSMGEPDIGSGGLDNSAAYTFTGIRNTTATGTPVSIVYGLHRVGGNILNLYTESSDTDTELALKGTPDSLVTDNILKYQIALCEGEVASISDIEINKLPSSYYSDVTLTSDRLGYEEQQPIAEFNQITNTLAISRKIVVYDANFSPLDLIQGYYIMYGYVENNQVVMGLYKVGLYEPQEGGVYLPNSD